eukprot:gene4399-3200_t
MLSSITSKGLAELLGTFMFTLTIPLADLGVGTLAPLAIGFMLCAMCITFGYISEAHFNPAISFAAFLNGRMELSRLVLYVVAQLLGSFLASFYGSAVANIDIPVPSGDLTTLTAWQTFLCELAFSFAIVTVVLHVCYSGNRNNDLYGFAVSFVLVSAGLCMGGVVSGSFNPAVATGSQMVACLYGTCEPLLWCWIYWVGPILGAFLASVAYQVLEVDDSSPLGMCGATQYIRRPQCGLVAALTHFTLENYPHSSEMDGAHGHTVCLSATDMPRC